MVLWCRHIKIRLESGPVTVDLTKTLSYTATHRRETTLNPFSHSIFVTFVIMVFDKLYIVLEQATFEE